MAIGWTVSIDWRASPRVITTLLRGSQILVRARDPKLLHPEIERRPLDSQTCGRPVGAGDNPPGLIEDLANVVPLRVLQGNCPKGFRFGGTLQTRERGCRMLPEVRITL